MANKELMSNSTLDLSLRSCMILGPGVCKIWVSVCEEHTMTWDNNEIHQKCFVNWALSSHAWLKIM